MLDLIDQETSTPHSLTAATIVQESTVIDVAGILRWGGIDAPDILFDPLDLHPQDLDPIKSSGTDILHVPVIYRGDDPHTGTFRALAQWNSLIAGNDRTMMRISGVDDLDHARQTDRLGFILGVHESNHFRSVDDVDLFHALGQRISLLTNNGQNLIGSGFTEISGGGLSNFGRAVVARMNAVGMALDISHCNDRTKIDVLEHSSDPVLISHGNCRALNDNPRLETDDMIRRIAKQGGVIGVCGLRMFLTGSEPTTADAFVDHISHIADIAGIEHVALGIDVPIQGWDSLPEENKFPLPDYMRNEGLQRPLDVEGLTGPDRIRNIAFLMLQRGFAPNEVLAVLGENTRRLFAAAWRSQNAQTRGVAR